MPTLNSSTLAQQYGFALAFLNSDKSLKALFQSAVKGNWTVDKFTAEMKNTDFYKKNADTVRQTQLLKTSDPATYNARKAALIAQLNDRATQIGAVISADQMSQVAEHALMFNWNDSQTNDTLGAYVRAVNGVYNGSTGSDVETIKQTAWRNGVALSDTTVNSWAQNIAQGKSTAGYYQQYVRNMAKTAAPGFASQLDAGLDLYDIADPYRQSMAKTLEIDPATIDLNDQTIRKALSATGPDGKPTSKSLWQFENELRQDSRWLATDNARQAGFSVAHKVLNDFGFAT